MKYLPMSLKAVENDDGSGEFEAILSTSAEDRDREVVSAGAFDPLPASIPIYYQHDWQQKALPIGRGTPFYDEDGSLRIKGYYGSDERSQSVRKAVGEGLVDSMSAGYLPLQKRRSNGTATVVKADLFEGSMTAIPVNKTALVTASKSIEDGETKAGARNSATDGSRLQQIHDLAVENGAACGGMKAIAATKAIIGSVEALQDRVRDALGDTYGYKFCCLRGVVPADGGGTCYFDSFGDDGIDSYSQTFTDDGKVVTLTGDATEVVILETVQPDADADPENNELKSTDEATTSTATKAVDNAAPSADELAARLKLSEAALNLAFTG